MYKQFIKNNLILSAITIFLLVFGVFAVIKPNFLFTKDGAIRHFGLGKSRCTIVPIWLLVIILSITIYMFLLILLR
tara:strand:+ start:14 stop:241 length:228 start_codon:yes stop_codon:yes gene_type:complete